MIDAHLPSPISHPILQRRAAGRYPCAADPLPRRAGVRGWTGEEERAAGAWGADGYRWGAGCVGGLCDFFFCALGVRFSLGDGEVLGGEEVLGEERMTRVGGMCTNSACAHLSVSCQHSPCSAPRVLTFPPPSLIARQRARRRDLNRSAPAPQGSYGMVWYSTVEHARRIEVRY